MKRRAALERMSLMLGGAAVAPEIIATLQGQVTTIEPSVEVDAATEAFLAEVGDVIIPETDTPGAKAAGAEQFILRAMRDCYTREKQEAFYAGLARIDKRSQEAHGKSFVDLDREMQIEVLNTTVVDDLAYFKTLRTLVVTGYFTSEIGATEALAYLAVPGQFIGDVPMKPGQKTWAL